MTRLSSLALLLSLAGLASAQDSQPTSQPAAKVSLQVEATVPEQVILGEEIEIQVKVTNTGSAALPLRPIALSSHSTFSELKGERWKRTYHLLRFPGGLPNLTPQKQQPLEPGKAIEGKLVVPTVATGPITFRVGYTGHVPFPVPQGQRPTPFYSQPIQCTVRPTKLGAVRYRVLMKTNHGEVRLSLDDEAAPGTVRNFVTLIRKGFYSNLSFHRVIKGFMIQGGDPKGDGSGGPGYSILAEFSRERRHKPGALAMARTNHPHTAGSQFYVCLGAPSHLDGQYTIFGQVIEGQSVIDAIGALPTGAGDVPKQAATIESMTLEAIDAEGKLVAEPPPAVPEPTSEPGEKEPAPGK